MATNNSEVEDDLGSGWFQVKKKHRTTSKSSIRGFVGEASCKLPSSFLQNQSSVNERNGKSSDRLRSCSEARKDFTRNILVAHGECSTPDSKKGEKVISLLDKCISNQDTKPSKSSSVGSINNVETNDNVQNVQVVPVTTNISGIPKIKWGDLDVDMVLFSENLERVEMVFGNLGDDKLAGHYKLDNDKEFVSQDSFCNEQLGEKEAIVLADGEHSPSGASSVTLTTECCKELNEITSEYVKLLNADDKRANINDYSIHKVSEHIESVNNLLRECVKSRNPDNKKSLSEGTEIMLSPCGHGKSDDGAVDIPEVPVEEGISNSVLDDQDSIFRPAIKSGPEVFSDDLVADVVEDVLHGDETKVEFSKAYVPNVEEGESGESKERFRQRLWCFMFENLNRAVDELYLLCELECDLDQMKEAVLVLEEAASDFKELILRVEGFENVKGSFSQLLVDGLSMNAKGDHRRPHALSWEVRRMTASPHRAEILSSSLEAFKKIQNERNRIHPIHKKKTIDCAFANNLSNNISGMSGGKDVETKTTKLLMKSEQCRVSDLGQGSLIKEKQDIEGSESSKTYLVQFGSCDSDSNASQVPLRNHPAVFVAGNCTMESIAPASESEKPMTMKKDNMLTETRAEKNIKGSDSQRRKMSSDKEKDKEKKNTVSWKSMDAWKEKRNWEDVLSVPLRPSSRASHSAGIMRKNVERARVLHDKLMSPEKKKKTALDLKKEAEEKHARAMRIRTELENERVQRLQRTSEKLNRVNEWQAVRNMKLREGMHARHQRSESRHEAYLAEVVRRAGDESSKVNEVRFITSLNEENKKLILRQKLHDSELRRAEKLQMIKSKQKEDMAREEAALERRRLLQAERLQRLAETQRKKEEAQVRREEERKASSAAREAKAMEQVRRQEFRARAQQEEAELLAQKLAERLSESEQRRKIYLEQIRERASMDLRDQSSPSIRRSSNKDSRSSLVGNVEDCQANNNAVIAASASRESDAVSKQPLKRRIKKIRQRLMALKYEFPEPSISVESAGIGYRSIVGTARAKIGRWIQELQRLRQARKEGATSITLIIGDIIKFLEGKEPELHASRQAGLLDFIASALPASHTSRPETCQVIIYLVRLLRIVLSLPANRSYFLSQNLLPPIIPMLSAALENYIKIAASVNASGSTNSLSSKMSGENFELVSEVLEGFLWVVTSVMGHASLDERQILMQEGLLELVLAYQVIHRLRDLFALQDRLQAEGLHFPSCIILSLNLLAVLTSRPKTLFSISGGIFPSEEVSANPTQESEVAELVDLENSSFNTTDGDYVNRDEPLSDVPKDRPLDESCKTSISRDSSSSRFPQKDLADVSVELKSASLQMHATEASQNSMIEWPMKSYLHRKDVKGSTDIDAGQKNDKAEHPKEPVTFLLSVIVETSLVSLPSLLTAVLLQANSRSSSEQGSYMLPSNFEEVATGVLKVLNNLALLDLILLQRMLGRPDLKMEFFHLMSFLLSHCSSKWKVATDQVGQLLLESLLLLGYFALFHPGNQAVLRWGKSPTILHKVCDLPFVFFSNPELMPILAGTIVAACYGCEQNRDVVQHELSTDMVLSLLGSCRNSSSPTESNPSIQDDPTLTLEPHNPLGLDHKKYQFDLSGRCSRPNVRNTRSSSAKLGPAGSSSTRGSKIRNQRDSKATKGCEMKQNLPGLGSPYTSTTMSLHSRIPSSIIDKLEEFFSTGVAGATTKA